MATELRTRILEERERLKTDRAELKEFRRIRGNVQGGLTGGDLEKLMEFEEELEENILARERVLDQVEAGETPELPEAEP